MNQPHVFAVRTYVGVFATLLGFTVLTVGAAYVDLGLGNNVVALTIAMLKAVLVMLYFMHLRYGSGLTRVWVGAGFFWLVLLIGMTMGDVLMRPGPGPLE